MVSIQSVFEFFKEVPLGARHEERYLESLASRQSGVGSEAIDMVGWESSTWGVADHNILVGLHCPYKFQLKGMRDGFEISANMLAKQKNAEHSHGSMKNGKNYKFDFRGRGQIDLEARGADIVSGEAGGLVYERDKLVRRRILSACANLKGRSGDAVGMLVAGEKLGLKTDMRHMLLKGVLYLLDYTLAATDGTTERSGADIRSDVRNKVSAEERVAAIAAHRVVVDMKGFTDVELDLLMLMSAPFPSVDYADGSFYTNITMEEDDVVFVSDDDRPIVGDTSFGSVEGMYITLCNVAAKLGCLEDLREVLRDSRGLGYLTANLVSLGVTDFLELTYPKSICYRASLGEVAGCRDVILKYSNWYATSKNLLLDHLHGQALMAAAYNVLDGLGAWGPFGCPTGNCAQDHLLHSRMREYGLKDERLNTNVLLQEWFSLRGHPMPFGTSGHLKSFLGALGAHVTANGSSRDLFMPSMLFEMGFSQMRDSIWNEIHGLYLQYPEAKIPQTIKAVNRQKAFAWLFGVGDGVPLVGLNELGEQQFATLTDAENAWYALAEGEYRVTMVTYNLQGNPTGRKDALECTAMSLYNSYFKGGRVVTTYDSQGQLMLYSPPTTPKSGADLIGNTASTLGASGAPGSAGAPSKPQQDAERKASAELTRKAFEAEKDRRKGAVPEMASVKLPNLNNATRQGGPPVDECPNANNVMGLKSKGGYVPSGGESVDQDMNKPYNYEVLFAKGDGACGINAIVMDLVLNGIIAKSDAELAWETLAKEAGRRTWHSPDELVVPLLDRGMGLEIIQETKSPGGAKIWNVMAIGTKDAVHVVRLLFNGGGRSGKGHYDLIWPCPKGKFKMSGKYPGVEETPEQARAGMRVKDSWWHEPEDTDGGGG